MDVTGKLDLIRRCAIEMVGEENLARKLREGRALRIKLGVDPTTCDLHLGHSVVLDKLRLFQDMGHTAVLIIGDFTARVGDPSGRDLARPMLDEETVRKNAETYTAQAFKILNESRTELRRNSEWLGDFVGSGEFLKTAKGVTISRLMERDDFRERIRSGGSVSLLEILYPVFQGYDSVVVKADVELGGSDQIFNLLVGRDLQKIHGMSPQAVLTLPLLVGTDGVRKMSKSYGNYIAVNDEPGDMFGKIMSVSDDLMESYYEILLPDLAESATRKHPMEAKKNLAAALVEKYWGKEAAAEALKKFEKVFSKKESPGDMEEYRLPAPRKLSDLIFGCGLAGSRNEARRLISQGAVKIDGGRVESDFTVEPGSFTLRVGRRHFRRITNNKKRCDESG